MSFKAWACRILNIRILDYNTGYLFFTIFNYILILTLAVIWLYPILNVISSSVSEPRAVMAGEIGIFPKKIDFSSYKMVWETNSLRIGIFNSLFYACVGCVICVFFIALTAYPLSKKRFVFRKWFTLYMTITMFFSGGLIPTFILVNKLGLYNTRTWIIMASMFSTWHIIIMRTFFQNIPVEMEESAQLDGCTDLIILLKIYVPLSTPVIATITLFTIVGFWNSYFVPLVYLVDNYKMPMQVVLRDLMMKGGDYTMFNKQVTEEFQGINFQMFIEKLKYTAIVITMLPMIILFLSLQKYFVKGVLIGSIKG
jgi:putative aldouronate transport system permease protein